MNPERRIKWIEDVASFLTRAQLSVERLYHKVFPEKHVELLDMNEFEEECEKIWIEEFRNSLI